MRRPLALATCVALLAPVACAGGGMPPSPPESSYEAKEVSIAGAPPPPAPVVASAPRGYFADAPLAAGSVGGRITIAQSKARAPSAAPARVAPAAPGGAGPSTTPKGPATAPKTPAAPDAPPDATTQPAPHRESMLIYTATLILAVYQVESSLDRIEELARSVGGYLANRSDAQIIVRIPRAKFQEALAGTEKLGDVLHRDVQAEDVGDQVVDLEARLKSARAVRERLSQLLQGATATKDALEIERELARVMADIESMEGKLQLFADKMAYSTLTVRFQALHTNEVHAMARLPFPWLQELGLSPLLRVK